MQLCRVIREGKERRRKWAQRKTPRKSKGGEGDRKEDEELKVAEEAEPEKESLVQGGMLPSDIVELLAAREKYVLLILLSSLCHLILIRFIY